MADSPKKRKAQTKNSSVKLPNLANVSVSNREMLSGIPLVSASFSIPEFRISKMISFI